MGTVNRSIVFPADTRQIQAFQDSLAEALGIAVATTDAAGNFLTKTSGISPIDSTTSSCEVVKMAIRAGLPKPEEDFLFLSCDGAHYILVPMYSGNSLVGVIVAADPSDAGSALRGPAVSTLPKLLSSGEMSLGELSRQQTLAVGKLLHSVGRSIVEMERKQHSANQWMHAQAAIYETADIMNSILDLHTLSDIAVKKAAEIAHAESAFLAMLGEGNGNLNLCATVGVASSGRRQVTVGVCRELVLETSQTGELTVQVVSPPNRSEREPGHLRFSQQVSAICMPLKANGKVLAVLGVANRTRNFLSEEVELIQSLGTHAAFAIANAMLYEHAQQTLQKLHRLLELGAEINSIRSLDDVLREVNRNALEATQGMACNITLIDDDGRVKIRAAVGFSIRLNRRILVRPNGLSMQVKQSGQPIAIPDTAAAADSVNPIMVKAGVKASLCLPLRTKDKVIGVMWVHYAHPRSFPQSDINLLLGFANQAAVAIDNAQLRDALIEQATRDGKTGLFNHDYFFARLRLELEKAKLNGFPLSMIMLDIDNFKEYNDRFGHLAGDEALRMIATAIGGTTRRSDIVARYGGEEFAVLLPNTDAERALMIAERIRTSIESASQKASRPARLSRITISLGVSSYPLSASTENELIERADKALYRSKALGKNMASQYSS